MSWFFSRRSLCHTGNLPYNLIFSAMLSLCSRWEWNRVWSRSDAWRSSVHSGVLQADMSWTVVSQLSGGSCASNGPQWGKNTGILFTPLQPLFFNSLPPFLPQSEQHSPLLYQGRRSRTKCDLSMKMYEEEMQVRRNICRRWLDLLWRSASSLHLHWVNTCMVLMSKM